jgi:nitrous oxidase accessory protein NosD
VQRVLTVALCLALLAVAVSGGAVAAGETTATVDTHDGNNATADPLVVAPNGSGDYRSIQSALGAAADGETVLVRAGEYAEALTVDSNVTIRAEQGAVLEGEDVPSGFTGVAVTGSSAPRIDGLTVANFSTGVVGFGAGPWTLSNVTIRGSATDAVYVPGTVGDWNVRDSRIVDSGRAGVFAVESAGAWTIANTTVRNSTAGVVATRASGDWRLRGGVVAATEGDGVQAIETTGAWSLDGVAIDDTGDDGVDATRAGSDWTARNATVGDTGGYGIEAAETTGNWTIEDSTFAGNGTAVGASGTTGNWSVHGSQFRGRGDAVVAEGSTGGDATRNWWGDGQVPIERCRGPVRCDRALAAPNGTAGGDTDGDGLADRAERRLGTAPNRTDTDGDGLLDSWEVRGYDADQDGTAEVPIDEFGADPRRKDIFVEVDSLTVGGNGPWITQVPRSAVYGPVVAGLSGTLPLGEGPIHRSVEAMFAAAPVENPDGSTGIDLHVDTGQFDGGEYLADTGIDPTANRSRVRAFRRVHMADRREPIFHYGLVVPNATTAGRAFATESAFFVAASVDGERTTRGQFASTIAHEIGHSLGLLRTRGTAFDAVDTANLSTMAYPSVMNYDAPAAALDFSDRCAFDEWAWLADRSLAPRTPLERPTEPRATCLHVDRTVEGGAPVPVVVGVDNPGSETATVTVELRHNGTVATDRTVTLAPGQRRRVTLLVGPLSPGKHTLAVGPFERTVHATER